MKILVTSEGIARDASDDTLEILDLPDLELGASRYMRLDPGDVILTGSPAGAGYFRGVFLKASDEVELRADRIGTLRNPIVDSMGPAQNTLNEVTS